MRGKRIYITVPKRDYDLIWRVATLQGQCPGQWARDSVLGKLYHRLTIDKGLVEYDQNLARLEREEQLGGRMG